MLSPTSALTVRAAPSSAWPTMRPQVMRKGAVCVTAPGQPKAALTEIIVAAGKTECELVVPEEDDITFLRMTAPTARLDYGGYDVPPAFMGYHAACNVAVAVELSLALWRKGHDIQVMTPSWRNGRPPKTAAVSGFSPVTRW